MAENSNALAALGHGLGLVFAPFPALIIWLIKKDEDPFVDFHGKQALNFQLTAVIAMFVSAILSIVLIGLLFMPIIYVLFLVFTIMATVKAANGEEYEYPKWCTIPFLK